MATASSLIGVKALNTTPNHLVVELAHMDLTLTDGLPANRFIQAVA